MAFPPRRAWRLWAYWRAEQRTLRQGFIALFLSSGGDLLAGLALGLMTNTLERLPGLLLLVPAVIGMRGDILGALGSRLGTSIHAGTFRPTLRDRTGPLYQNVFASSVLTLATALYLGVIAWGVSVALGLPSISIADFLAISILGGVLGSAAVGGMTVMLARAAHRREWDMDAVAAPLVTATGDIVTLPALWAASFIARIPYVTVAVGVTLSLLCFLSLVRGALTDLPMARRTILESLPILGLAGVLHISAGVALERQLDRFVVFPALLVLVPPFLEDTGALGGILSARLASKLHLGITSPRLRPEGPVLVDVSINFVLAVSVFFFLGVSGWAVSTLISLESPGFAVLIGVAMVAGLIATMLSSAVAHLAAVATHRFGLDPDNHGIPIVTSTMDFLGAATLVAVIVLFGVSAGG